MEENNEKITDKRLDNLKEPWKPGQSGNPEGRPKGQRNYATIYREALIKLAEMNGMDAEQMETDILLKGLAGARKGDYRFYKDLLDRLHGQPVKKTELVDGEGNAVQPVLVKIVRDAGKPDTQGNSN